MAQQAGLQVTFISQRCMDLLGECNREFVERPRRVKPAIVGMMLGDALGEGARSRVGVLQIRLDMARTASGAACHDVEPVRHCRSGKEVGVEVA